MLADAAGHDAGEMREVRLDVDRDAVERHPVAHADADGGDLVFARSPRRTQTPTRSSRRSPLTLNCVERVDHPLLEAGHEGAHVAAAALEVEHHIGHALAGAVIGVLPAAPRLEHREAVGAPPGPAAWAEVPAV